MLRGDQLIALEWSLVAFTFVLIVLRLYARWRLRGTLASWQDLFATLSWFCFLSETLIDTDMNRLGFFNPTINAKLDYINEKVGSVTALKLQYVEGATYSLCMYSVKAAMLCFYSHVIPFTMRKTRIMLWVTTAYVSIGFITAELVSLLACQPISLNWSLSPTEYCGAAWSSKAGIVLPSFFHLSSDILLYCLPFPIFRVLSLPKKQKIGIAVTFALGFLCVFFACCVLAANYLSSSLVTGWFFACLEQTWAICVVCAPAFKLFLTRDLGGLLKRWRSKVSSTVGTAISTRRQSMFQVFDAGISGQHGQPGDTPAFQLEKLGDNIMHTQHSRWEVDSERGREDDEETAIASPNSSKVTANHDDDAITNFSMRRPS